MRAISAQRLSNFRRRLSSWYQGHGRTFPWRHPNSTTYERVISELLLQRTRAEVAASFLPLFLKEFPSWSALARSDERRLGEFLRPIGLWRRRAATLLLLSGEMVKRQGHFPRSRAELEGLPGIGQYVANSVMLQVHDTPEPLLDVNMARVLERYFGRRQLADIRYDPYLQALGRRVLLNTNAMEMNWAILDLAAKICLIRNPRCALCPVRGGCKYAALRAIQLRPNPPFKAPS